MVVSFVGCCIMLSLLVATCDGASGEIIVYDNEGKVERVERFNYDSSKSIPRKRTRVVEEKKVEEPEPPKGLHFMKEEPEEDVPEIDVEDDNDGRNLHRKKKKKSRKSERDALGRKKKIKKIRNMQIRGRNVQVITRKETDRSGRVFETKEWIIDNRSNAKSGRQQFNANKNAPDAKRFKTEVEIPTYKRRGYP